MSYEARHQLASQQLGHRAHHRLIRTIYHHHIVNARGSNTHKPPYKIDSVFYPKRQLGFFNHFCRLFCLLISRSNGLQHILVLFFRFLEVFHPIPIIFLIEKFVVNIVQRKVAVFFRVARKRLV